MRQGPLALQEDDHTMDQKSKFQQLRQRASLPAGSPGARKDLADVPAYVDIHATTASFRMKKGDYKYATDHHHHDMMSVAILAQAILAQAILVRGTPEKWCQFCPVARW